MEATPWKVVNSQPTAVGIDKKKEISSHEPLHLVLLTRASGSRVGSDVKRLQSPVPNQQEVAADLNEESRKARYY